MTLRTIAGAPLARKPLTLVLLNRSPGAEWDWIRHLLARFDIETIVDPDGQTLKPGALYIYYNDKGLELPQGFLERVAKLDGCGFLHCGDEYFRAPMRAYASFDYVVRSPWTDLLAGPGVLGIPIGPSNDLQPRPSKPASERALVWSFAGGRRRSRVNMATIFSSLTPHLSSLPDVAAGEKHISRNEYLDALSESRFVPCVEGNIILETLRPYEALAYGAIPILPRRPFADTYRSILEPDHPLPTFLTWKEAAQFVQRMNADPAALNALQARTQDWWSGYQDRLADRLGTFIEKGQSGAMRQALRSRFLRFGGAGWQARRIWELTRQQSGGQIHERLEKLPNKAIARLQGKSTAGVWSLGASGDPGRDGRSDKQ